MIMMHNMVKFSVVACVPHCALKVKKNHAGPFDRKHKSHDQVIVDAGADLSSQKLAILTI